VRDRCIRQALATEVAIRERPRHCAGIAREWTIHEPDKLLAALQDLRPSANAKLRFFAMTIGEHDGLTTQFHLLKDTLDAQGIHVSATVVPGYIHEWAFWRYALADMLPRLFQPAP